MRKIIIFLLFCFACGDEIYASFDIVAKQISKLSLEKSGVVSEIHVDIGDSVKKGDLLLTLETASDEISLSGAQNDLAIATELLRFATSTNDRYERLGQAVSQQERDQISQQFEQAKLNVAKAQIAIQAIQDQIAKKSLYAPFDGVILSKFVEVGQGVAGAAQALFEMYSTPEVKILLSFDARSAHKVAVGDTFVYSIDGREGEFQGVISKIYPSIDPKTRKISAEVIVTDQLIGGFGEGRIITK